MQVDSHPLIAAGKQHGEFIASNACGTKCFALGGTGQHFASAAQHRIARCVSLVVVHCFEAIQINGKNAQGPRPFARDAVQLFCVEGTVAQARQRIVPAQVFQIGLRFFARGDVDQGQQHQIPIGFVARHHHKLHMNVDQITAERIIHHLTGLCQLALPQVGQLIGKGGRHLVSENMACLTQQLAFAGGSKHLQGLLVHIEHLDLCHASRHKLMVNADENTKILDTPCARLIQQALDAAEILHPQRNG